MLQNAVYRLDPIIKAFNAHYTKLQDNSIISQKDNIIYYNPCKHYVCKGFFFVLSHICRTVLWEIGECGGMILVNNVMGIIINSNY